MRAARLGGEGRGKMVWLRAFPERRSRARFWPLHARARRRSWSAARAPTSVNPTIEPMAATTSQTAPLGPAGAPGGAPPSRAATAGARPGLGTGLVLALWFGAAAGATELLVLGWHRVVEREFLLFNAHVLWMAPLSAMLLLAPVGLAAGLGARFLAPRHGRRIVVFVPALVASGSVLFLWYPALARPAIVLLALGAATQCTRWAEPRLARFRRFAGRALVVVAGVLAATFGAVTGAHALAERRSAALVGPAAPGAPNVVLIILDTVRALEMSLYGNPLPTTPWLDRWARGGVVFEDAFSAAPWTLASHASLFTGRWPDELSVGWATALDDRWPTLAEVLRSHGYETAGFVANVEYAGAQTGLARGFVHYDDVHPSPAELLLSSSLGRMLVDNPKLRSLVGYYDVLGRKHAADVNREVLGWLPRQPRRPLFLFLNYLDAHEPYLPDAAHWAEFGAGRTRRNDLIRFPSPRRGERAFKAAMTPAQRETERLAHDAALAGLDESVGRLLAELKRRGVLDNAVVVLAADHGEQFGEHELFSHGNSLYAQLLHVPLVIVDARVLPAGTRVSTPVSLRDVGATLLDLAGIRDAAFPGTSLVRRWTAPGAPVAAASPVVSEVEPAAGEPARYPAAKAPMRSVVIGRWHFIRREGGPEQLYDDSRDPAELHDLVRDPALAPVVARARLLLDSQATSERPRAGRR